MMNVFIGGSRSVTRLNKAVTRIMDRIVGQGQCILIGDANGTDRAVQAYLAAQEYQYVVVFCTRGVCRNNLGGWKTRSIDTLARDNTFQFHAVKDLAMASEADRGFMIWDSRSKGTLSNIINLVKAHIPVDVYSTRTKASYEILDRSDLASLLDQCDPASRDKFEKELNLSDFLLQPSFWS